MNKVIVWKGIEFSDNWKSCNTKILDLILPSWEKARERLLGSPEEYKRFLEKLKREQAIETGILERLYDLERGVTETLIEHGFHSDYIERNASNIPTNQLMAHLQDHIEAIDFVFDYVNGKRKMSESFIKELHQLITRNQSHIETIDQFGKRNKTTLLKGEYKKYPNNPSREDGTSIEYCLPLNVNEEMSKMISIYESMSGEVHPIVISAWFHHSFTQIHPFQDGNGRLARLLATLVLIKNNLLPFNVKRDERVRYIEALENADKENPQLLVDFFADTQKNIIEKALQINTADPLISSSFLDVVSAFSAKLTSKHQHEEESRNKSLANNRQIIFDHCDSLLNVVKDKMETMLNIQEIKKQARLYINKCSYEDEKAYYFGRDIIALAKKHDYYFNRSLPRAWFRFGLQSKEKEYELIITLHHYGYGDSTIAIGAFFQDQSEKNEGDSTYLPLSLTKEDKPLTISIDSSEDKITLHCEERIPDYLERILSLMMIQIMGELG